MRHTLLYASIILLMVYINSCANQGSPTGGPRDTLPPILQSSLPINKSVNIKSNEFSLTFDEYINADQIKSKLIITPRFENQFNYRIKKNSIIIKFEDNFDDSTTYTLNFADGITDVTEKNPAVNLSLAFSTGPTIDSMYVKGSIKDLYTNLNSKEILIALFDHDDTLDIFTGKPKYFTSSDNSGNFSIENVKDGLYKLYAFNDKNGNLQNESNEESHGFLSDLLDLTSPQDSIEIKIQLIDSSPLKFIRSKTTGRYYDIQYNKYIDNYVLQLTDSTKQQLLPPNNLVNNQETIRFYPVINNLIEKDSLQIIVHASDSLSNSISDTVYVQFRESTRKPESFSMNIKPKNNSILRKNLDLLFTFDKPIKNIITDSLLISYDTVQYLTISDTMYQWNKQMTELKLSLQPDKSILPAASAALLQKYQEDSITAVQTLPDSLLEEALSNRPRTYENKLTVNVRTGAFISVDNDSTEAKKFLYPFPDANNFGIISGTINTEFQHYTLQLVDPEFNVINQVNNVADFRFDYVEPGKYSFRVLIDDNGDGKWSAGNILSNTPPESIWFYEETFDIRANWQVENIELIF